MARMEFTANERTAGVWAADALDSEHLLPAPLKLDPAQFMVADAVPVVLTANAAQGAVAITVAALSGPIPNGTVLRFSADEFATVNAAAAAGATSVTVQALVNALESGDAATYAGSGTKLKSVQSGTPIGRTIAEQESDDMYGPADEDDDFIYLLAFTVADLDKNNDGEAYRPGSVVKYNKLPGWDDLDAGVQDQIRERYICIKGAA